MSIDMTTQPKAATNDVVARPTTLKGMLADVKVKSRFEEILGKKAPAFISSIISAVQTNKQLQECDPESIIGAAAVAASLDLPINGNLGFAAIVPYRQSEKVDGEWRKKSVAQFQIMSRGFVQLAQRSGQYTTMNVTEVYDGELVSNDSFTGELRFDKASKKSDKVIGYVFYFKLVNGFEKYTYMTVEQIQAHGKKFSKSYENDGSMWKKDFHAMALKTVVKRGLSKWGPLSTEMQKAARFDQSAVNSEGEPEYIDVTTIEESQTPAAPALASPRLAAPEGQVVDAELHDFDFVPAKVTKSGDTIYAYDGEVRYWTKHEGVGALAKAAKEKKARLVGRHDGGAQDREILEAKLVEAAA